MIAPAIDWRELQRLARIIGAWLLTVGGVALIVQPQWTHNLPPPDGYAVAHAYIMNKEQRGTFQSPSFSVTLAYRATSDDATIRSGRRVPFEVYHALAEGDTMTIHYDVNNPYVWVPADSYGAQSLNDYVLGILMIVFGLFSLAFPKIISLASREDDFQYREYHDEAPAHP